MGIFKEITTTRRNFFIRLKSKLKPGIWELFHKYPEPTKENCSLPNSHVLLEIWDEFFKYEDNPSRTWLFKTLRRVMMGEYEHDWYYRTRMEWFVEKIIEAYLDGRWQPREPIQPDRRRCWKEPLGKDTLLNWIEFQRFIEKDSNLIKVGSITNID